MRNESCESSPYVSYDHPKEECGVVAVHMPGEEASRFAFFGLFALQHRGQESAGIATSDGEVINVHSQMGLVTQIFREQDFYPLVGDMAIGHTRYSTTGSSLLCNAQPIVVEGYHGKLALAHNGNIINTVQLKNQLKEQSNCSFSSTTDSEIIALLMVNAPGNSWHERAFHCMNVLNGAYSFVALTHESIIAVRDPLGIRPLCLGTINGGWIVASESCALEHIGAEYVRDVDPGEVILIDNNGMTSKHWDGGTGQRAACVFELIYFARPDSIMEGSLVYASRQQMGAELAKEHPVDADIVIGVPDSATAAAVGYSQEAQIPFSEGLMKNRYVGRTFILPDQRLRDLGVRRKLNPLPDLIRDKRVVVVDDSIVRGTTTPHVVNLLRKGGATEIHLRVCAPPIMWPCHFGIDMATRKELLAANKTVEQIREYVGADSLGYLSHEGLLRAVDADKNKFCMACFTGEYPVPVQLEMDKLVLEI